MAPIEITTDEGLADAERELADLQTRRDEWAVKRSEDLEMAILAYRERQRGHLEKSYPPEE
jgi:hypothetical protein